MLNLDLLGAIAFDKGCYTGQEVIARAHYRGRVKRRLQRWRPVAARLLPGDGARAPDGRALVVVRVAAPNRATRKCLRSVTSRRRSRTSAPVRRPVRRTAPRWTVRCRCPTPCPDSTTCAHLARKMPGDRGEREHARDQRRPQDPESPRPGRWRRQQSVRTTGLARLSDARQRQSGPLVGPERRVTRRQQDCRAELRRRAPRRCRRRARKDPRRASRTPRDQEASPRAAAARRRRCPPPR